jgi:hypothetical protein
MEMYTIRVVDTNRDEFYVAINGAECRGRCNTWITVARACLDLLAGNQRDFFVQTPTGIEQVNAAEFAAHGGQKAPEKRGQKESGKEKDESTREETGSAGRSQRDKETGRGGGQSG